MKATFDNIFKIGLFVAGVFFGFWLKGCTGSKPAPCPCDGKIISTVTKSDTTKQKLSDEASDWHVNPVPIDSSKFLEGGDIDKAIKTGQYFHMDHPSDETWGNSIHHWKISKVDTTGKAVNEPEKESDYDVSPPTFMEDYLSTHKYSEIYHLKQGDVIVNTNVSANRMDSQQVILSNFQKEIITTTSTIKELVTEPKRNEMYLGISAMGNIAMPFYAFGPSLSFKTKTDRVLEAGVLYTRSNSIMYQFGLKLKISFRKN